MFFLVGFRGRTIFEQSSVTMGFKTKDSDFFTCKKIIQMIFVNSANIFVKCHTYFKKIGVENFSNIVITFIHNIVT